jgi:hypothetical protein
MLDRIHQNPTALLKTGSFRPFVYSAGLAGYGDTAVFKTSALNHSAIPPTARIPMTGKRILSSGANQTKPARIRKNRARIQGWQS